MILNLFKSFNLDLVYPNDILTFMDSHGQSSHQNSNSGVTGTNETTTGGLGPLSEVMKPIIEKLGLSIVQKYYCQILELIIDNCLDEFYDLPVFLLHFCISFSDSIRTKSGIQDSALMFCILPPDIPEQRLEEKVVRETFCLSRHFKNYEHILLQIIKDRDTPNPELLKTFNAFLSLHSLQTNF